MRPLYALAPPIVSSASQTLSAQAPDQIAIIGQCRFDDLMVILDTLSLHDEALMAVNTLRFLPSRYEMANACQNPDPARCSMAEADLDQAQITWGCIDGGLPEDRGWIRYVTLHECGHLVAWARDGDRSEEAADRYAFWWDSDVEADILARRATALLDES